MKANFQPALSPTVHQLVKACQFNLLLKRDRTKVTKHFHTNNYCQIVILATSYRHPTDNQRLELTWLWQLLTSIAYSPQSIGDETLANVTCQLQYQLSTANKYQFSFFSIKLNRSYLASYISQLKSSQFLFCFLLQLGERVQHKHTELCSTLPCWSSQPSSSFAFTQAVSLLCGVRVVLNK